ncbi:hypothetical protein B2J93_3315 [Marssonina coronariae]|uniref:Uncharacterized protein n=1 Tax=Diplocarpon coronariae TaxID=2795749 RepID=A0A218ZBT4_9HELO|nr:hypothetical protein B2J93_3315 [Marssonina coronariae]
MAPPVKASVIANRTPIDARGTYGSGGGGVLRVYTQDVYGGIRESGYSGSGSSWFGGDKVIGTAKIDSPIAIRLYYISADFKLKELAYDDDKSSKGWFDGELNDKNYSVAPYSAIAATYLATDQLKIRVYVQSPDDTVQEYSNDGSWYKDQSLGTALPGSSLAVTAYKGGPNASIRLYYQTPNLDLIEKAHDDGGHWETGGFSVKSATARATISVTSWTWSSGTGIRVYYTGPNDTILEKGNDGSWYDGAFKQASIPGSQVGSLSWYASGSKSPEIRVYFQNGTEVTAVTEWKWQGAWSKGHPALPPASQ